MFHRNGHVFGPNVMIQWSQQKLFWSPSFFLSKNHRLGGTLRHTHLTKWLQNYRMGWYFWHFCQILSVAMLNGMLMGFNMLMSCFISCQFAWTEINLVMHWKPASVVTKNEAQPEPSPPVTVSCSVLLNRLRGSRLALRDIQSLHPILGVQGNKLKMHGSNILNFKTIVLDDYPQYGWLWMIIPNIWENKNVPNHQPLVDVVW